jgi:GMP synthase-like glutamine amidotransferase
MSGILVIQHHSNSGLGRLEPLGAARGVVFKRCFPLEQGDPIPRGTDGYDGLIVLGGTPNAYEDERYPHLRPTAGLIRAFHAAARPVLGICLGSQLVARAFGAAVYKAPRSEIGFYPLELMADARHDPLLTEGIADPVHLIEFHYDTFQLPAGAVQLLAGAADVYVQAFRMDETSYAFQPHFEVNAGIMDDWLKGARNWVEREHPDVPVRIAGEFARYGATAAAFAEQVGGRWFDLVQARANDRKDGS